MSFCIHVYVCYVCYTHCGINLAISIECTQRVSINIEKGTHISLCETCGGSN